MRKNVDVKAAVIVTDGLSKKADLTKAAADALRAEVGVIFGVSIEGVSNYTEDEMARMKETGLLTTFRFVQFYSVIIRVNSKKLLTFPTQIVLSH